MLEKPSTDNSETTDLSRVSDISKSTSPNIISTKSLDDADDNINYLQYSDENLSFTTTKKVQISVRDLSIAALYSNSSVQSNPVKNIFKFKKNGDPKIPTDLESNKNESVKTILYPMSFDIPPNSLTCIVGGSGSGKTTLLNCLADRKFNKKSLIINGQIKYNKDDSLSSYRNAYVIQQDILIPTLTCFEMLSYSAELKLPKLTSKIQRNVLVNEIIAILGLNECKDTLIGDNKNKGLSGGEKRRLSVGLQLISNPSVLFLDEPTTGLDNYNAYLLCKSFQHLAKRLNKTIIMSIHQPRADIFKLFDTVLILSKGRLCYGDSYNNIFGHFQSLGYKVPELKVNPADYYVDITSIDNRSLEKEVESSKRVEFIAQIWKEKMDSFPAIDNIEVVDHQFEEDDLFKDTGRAPFWREVNILTRRNLKLQYRDPIGWFSILFEALFLGLLCGWLFFKPGTSSVSGLRSIEASLYTSTSLECYLFLLYETYRLCENDLKIFDRERMENSVSVTGFLLSRRIAKLITEDVWIPFLFSITTYFMYGLRTDSAKYFFKYFAGCFIFHLSTMTFATLSASITRDVAMATLISNLNFTFQSLNNGLIANAKQLPVYVRWCKYIAYLWYSFGYLASNQFSNYTSDCEKINSDNPNVDALCYQYSSKYVLNNLGFWENWNALPICVVLAFAIGHYIVAGVFFYIKPVDISMGKEIKTKETIDNSVDHSQLLEELQNERFQENGNNNEMDHHIPVESDNGNESVTLTIKNINLSVYNRLKRSNKQILSNINAIFHENRLNVIMGPSGSGKTSLLNLVSGRLSSNLLTQYTSSGEIYLNNSQINDYHLVRPVCSYVIQEDDHLLSSLTVRETLRYAARLRLSKTSYSLPEQYTIVDDIILKMGLKDCANTLVGNELIKGISGGEKRRLSIAIQLISSPKILFLDEPTSGLDSFTASSIVECLENLTLQGTTVIMTIHQPRSLDHFGSVLLLAKGGKVAFDGKEEEIIPYFSSIGYPMPKLTNLADFVIDLISYNTSNTEIEELTKSRVNRIIESWNDSTANDIQLPENSILLDNKSQVRKNFKSIIKEPANFIVGFYVLISRQWKGLIRDKNLLIARTANIVGMAIILSLFFARLKHNNTSIQDRLGLIHMCTSLYFTGMLNNIAAYPLERDNFYDEYNDDVVGLNSFFFSYFVLEVPFEVVSCFIYSIFIMFVIGLEINAGLFFTLFYTTFMIVNSGESLGISFNTIFDRPGFALNIISVMCSIGVCMAGVLAMTMDGFLKAINYVSPLHYCVMLISNQVFTDKLRLHCTSSELLSNGSCTYDNGTQVLEEYNLKVNLVLYYVLFSVVVVVDRAISWAFLRIKLMKIDIKKFKRS